MFYKMIQRKRDMWYSSSECTIDELISYIVNKGEMRDVQIDAIKTYLYLKIACENKPLWELFSRGYFNNLNVDDLEVKASLREKLQNNPAALALYEYSTLKNEKDEQVSEKLEKAIINEIDNIDFVDIFKKIFYNVSYTDYLFSLPMGAGKTYLMAAFIYLDLYFAVNEPDNNAFAHNFIIFAPSGLKSSVVPSLKTIKKFDPLWILPDPAASDIKRIIKFEILDQNKAEKRSNKTRNPNVQKIAAYQPFDQLIGLVAITNAEKVILDRVEVRDGQLSLFEDSEDEKDRQANELRNLIGKIPNMAIFIDEVHHASTDEIKLRAVVNDWMEKNNTINSVIGFSGTPYLDKAYPVEITKTLNIKSIEIANTVYYYPLIQGIDNFLKRPVVKISNQEDSLQIIEDGVRDFLNTYKDKTYAGDLTSKLAIYCGKGKHKSAIDYLEEEVYPCVAKIVEEYGMDPKETILKYHKGNKKHPISAESKLEFEALDMPFSKIRIILLVHIGKEGWDCRSLTGVILSQKGDCPTKMVLQTSCRCLRQVEKGKHESALIWLNQYNAEKLNMQLEKKHNISIKEFEKGANKADKEIKRYSRMDYLKLPKIDYYQLRVHYDCIIKGKPQILNPKLSDVITPESKQASIVKIQDFEQRLLGMDVKKAMETEPVNYNRWLYDISKESFGMLPVSILRQHDEFLRQIFNEITLLKNGVRYFSSVFNIKIINQNIRKLFYEKRDLRTTEEVIPQDARLLKIESLTSPVNTSEPESYYPPQDITEKIILEDKGQLKPDKKAMEMMRLAEETENWDILKQLKSKYMSHPEKDRSFHYLPYRLDSNFERLLLKQVLALAAAKKRNLEIYYNGDNSLTEFKIHCYKGSSGRKRYIGTYTPDFLIIKRKNGKIYKAIIVETKGSLYAKDEIFQLKRAFVEKEFIEINQNKAGYPKFKYLYLEDSLTESELIIKTVSAIEDFFEEEM
jgi:type III restriction enzyme